MTSKPACLKKFWFTFILASWITSVPRYVLEVLEQNHSHIKKGRSQDQK